ncbi:MAG TPA: hypothetical protein VKE74_03340 [Gemmataceae bacterium]|nr:hypothetical protein [Gemmataceae bacterium]
MGVEYVETAGRVFEVTITPDTPGYVRRTLTVRLVSGPPLTHEEWRRLAAAWVPVEALDVFDEHVRGSGSS